jgi:hypothetical protein
MAMGRAGCRCVLPLLLAACASAPPPASRATPLTTATPAQMVALVRAAAGDGDGELAVQPLRDPMVEDLRQDAARMEMQGLHAEAAAALDRALAIMPDDPAVLQERAEAALLLRDYAGSEQRALRAYELGARVGPLCRRHWTAIRLARLARGDAAGAAEARPRIDACRLAAPARY